LSDVSGQCHTSFVVLERGPSLSLLTIVCGVRPHPQHF